MTYHRPVLLKESLEGLSIRPDGNYVDATFGGGGHTRAILQQLTTGKVWAFDQDPDAAENAPDDEQFTLIRQNFRYLKNYLRMYGAIPVDGILADLGISSHQIDEPERGFSIRYNADLDMRMSKSGNTTAKSVVNTYSEEELALLFRNYGELKNARQLARLIASARELQPIETVFELKEVLAKGADRRKELQFYARVFQALRIEVNQELKALEEFLVQCSEVLKPGGRLVVISYHSLEDRIVKNYIKTGKFGGELEKDLYGNPLRPLDPVKNKVIVPGDKEIQDNSRARSAKLRIAAKQNEETGKQERR